MTTIEDVLKRVDYLINMFREPMDLNDPLITMADQNVVKELKNLREYLTTNGIDIALKICDATLNCYRDDLDTTLPRIVKAEVVIDVFMELKEMMEEVQE